MVNSQQRSVEEDKHRRRNSTPKCNQAMMDCTDSKETAGRKGLGKAFVLSCSGLLTAGDVEIKKKDKRSSKLKITMSTE